MDPTRLSLCSQELAARFTSRTESPSLLVANCPNLAELARKIFNSEKPNERDLNDFVYFSADLPAERLVNSEKRARLRGALAFIFCNVIPNDHDIFLIKQGNPEMIYTGKITKKFRDTWAFMEYKRANNFSSHLSYTYKSGQIARKSFQEALLEALNDSLKSWDDFRRYALERREIQLLTRPVIQKMISNQKNLISPNSGEFDLSQFISETVPDGTTFPENVEFTKTWILKNAGNVPWVNRSLQRLTPLSSIYPHSAMVIPIPDTMPDNIVAISVRVTTGFAPGFSEVRYKMIHKNGNFCWPLAVSHSLVLAIEVQGQYWSHQNAESLFCKYQPEPGS